MVFSSVLFLFYYLPAALLLYFITPRKYRNFVLLLVSLFFYSWGEPKYILIMLFSSVLDYTCGQKIYRNQIKNNNKRAKLWLLVSIIVNLSMLGFFKYSNFFLENMNNVFNLSVPLLNITLPIGISFYTFQTMSYTIDVYRKETDVQNSLIAFATYVTLFPQLIAGPIVRYKTVAKEIDGRIETWSLFNEGVKRFIIGLGKKVLLANSIGLLWENISILDLSTLPILTAWLGIIAFGFQIYFDFSGYSDMAIGLGKMFGFNFLENFNYPYTSVSITDFWRRWHISLGTWFKEYVYIPLGGNRVSLAKNIRNIFIVWLLTGIWHGASWNFLIWGLYFALLLIFEKFVFMKVLDKWPTFMRRIYTLTLVIISWVIFAFDSLANGFNYLKVMFNPISNNFLNNDVLYYLYTNAILIIILIFASTPLPKKIWNKYKENNKYMLLENILLILTLILVIANLVDQTYNPFLYFRF